MRTTINLDETLLTTAQEVSGMTERTALILEGRLMGRDIGYIDVHLLAPVVLAGAARLWTRDKRLAFVADDLALAFGKG